MRHLVITVLLSSAALQVQATGPIYRCGSSYSQTPCPGGALIDASDPRSAAQRSEASKLAAAERKRLARLERERAASDAAGKASAASQAETDKKKKPKVAPVVPLKAP